MGLIQRGTGAGMRDHREKATSMYVCVCVLCASSPSHLLNTSGRERERCCTSKHLYAAVWSVEDGVARLFFYVHTLDLQAGLL